MDIDVLPDDSSGVEIELSRFVVSKLAFDLSVLPYVRLAIIKLHVVITTTNKTITAAIIINL